MSEMSIQSIENNSVNGTGSIGEGSSLGRCSSAQQRGPGRYPATARMKWSKEVNKVVMECFYKCRPFDEEGKPIRGYRQRMYREWRERGMFESTEQRVCDQARAIRKNGWLSELELEAIRRQVENESQSDIYREQIEIEPVGNVDDIVEEELGDVRDSLISTVGCLDEDNRLIVKRLKEILAERKTCQGIIFKKVGRKLLKVQAERVNEALKYLESKSITETNNLIVAASVWVAEQLGLKKVEHRKKYEPFWKRRIEGDIRRLRQEVNIMERELKEGLGGGKKRKLLGLQEKYRVKRKGLKTVIEELKQRMLAKSAKVRRFEQRIEQFRQKKNFSVLIRREYTQNLMGGEGDQAMIQMLKKVKDFGEIFGVLKKSSTKRQNG